jgi:hypothetical protein
VTGTGVVETTTNIDRGTASTKGQARRLNRTTGGKPLKVNQLLPILVSGPKAEYSLHHLRPV